MNRVTVPGGWVDFRAPEEVPERLRRRVIQMAPSAQKVADGLVDNRVADEDMDFLFSFNDAIAACLVSGWSFQLPVTIDGLQELPGNVYDEIVKYCQPLVPRLMPDFGVDPDPKAPTGS